NSCALQEAGCRDVAPPRLNVCATNNVSVQPFVPDQHREVGSETRQRRVSTLGCPFGAWQPVAHLFGGSASSSPLGESAPPIFPSGLRSKAGAYAPTSCRLHQFPSRRLLARSVNQYCQRTVRTCRGGPLGNGLLEKSWSTFGSFWSSRASAFTTHVFRRHGPNDANHKFHSKRG